MGYDIQPHKEDLYLRDLHGLLVMGAKLVWLKYKKLYLDPDTMGVRVAIVAVKLAEMRVKELLPARIANAILPAFRIPRTGEYALFRGRRDNS
jgi:hypothetical protein